MIGSFEDIRSAPGFAWRTNDHTAVIDKVVAANGDHSNQVLVDLAALDPRTYIAAPDRGRRRKKNVAAREDHSERLERPNAHLYENRRHATHAPAPHANVLKRMLGHGGGFTLGLLMRTLVSVGTARRLQGRLAPVVAMAVALTAQVLARGRNIGMPVDRAPRFTPHHQFKPLPTNVSTEGLRAT